MHGMNTLWLLSFEDLVQACKLSQLFSSFELLGRFVIVLRVREGLKL